MGFINWKSQYSKDVNLMYRLIATSIKIPPRFFFCRYRQDFFGNLYGKAKELEELNQC